MDPPATYDERMRWALALAVVAAAGCGDEPSGPSPFCLSSQEAIAGALEDAPARAELEDGTPLSACVADATDAGDAQTFGTLATAVAEDLEERAEARDTEAALRLGFLVGAARRGGAQTSGLNAELVRRLERSAAIDETAPAVDDAIGRGVRAGEERG
jgi:hypothetical protein